MESKQKPSSSGGGQNDVESMMAKLGLTVEDLDDVVFDLEDQPPGESTWWLAVARVHMEREYSQYWFYKNMRSAWDLAQEVRIRSLGNNLYVLQSSCLRDYKKVMEGGPWTFRGNSVLLAP